MSISWLSRIVSRLGALFDGPRPQTSSRWCVTNLTRHTTLASSLELADSGQTRRKGLLGRHRLAPGEGLWIVPCESVHTFGMQFSIDLVYLDSRRRVRKLRENVPPARISVCFFAHSVLELPAGTIRATGTARGDTLELSAVSPEH